MNGIISGLLLSAVPYVVAMTVCAGPALAGEEGSVKTSTAVVVFSGDGADGEPVVVHGDSGGNFHWVSATATSGADGQSEGSSHVVRILRKSDAGAADQGWLGVMINAQDTGDGATVTLTDVIADSPADNAGLQAGDVVLSVDGEAISGNNNGLVDAIKAHKAGDDVTLVVLRDGNEETLTATLGSRADSSAATIEVMIDNGAGEIEDSIVTRGRMLKRGDDGEWIVTDLGDLGELDNLPAHIKMFVPQAGTRTMAFSGDESSRTVHVEIKGQDTLSIEQENGGDITVTRTDADGNKTVNVYVDEDELKADDERAYEAAYGAYDQSNPDGHQFIGILGDYDIGDFDFDFGDNSFIFSFDGKDFDASAFEWNENLEDGLAEANASAEQALDRARVLIEGLGDAGDGMPALAKLQQLRPLLYGGNGAQAFSFDVGKPQQSFEVRPDGTIAVTIRKGDTEVVQLFSDADDLADRKPDLFEKYSDLMDAKE